MKSIAASVLLWSLALSASAQVPSSKGVNFYSLDREVMLGQQVAADLAGILPIVHEAKLDAYIAKLGSDLAKYADHQFTYSFTVYEDRKSLPAIAATIAMPADAFHGQATEPVALPGGPVMVPMSLLDNAQSEAEFAFHLAHAMAHVGLRHSTRQATRAEIANMGNLPLSVERVSLEAAQAGNKLMPIGFMTFARRFELDADTVAIGILAAAGYDPETGFRYPEHSTVNSAPMSEVFSAHPAIARRLEAIRAAREQLPSRIYSAATGEFDEVHALAASIR